MRYGGWSGLHHCCFVVALSSDALLSGSFVAALIVLVRFRLQARKGATGANNAVEANSFEHERAQFAKERQAKRFETAEAEFVLLGFLSTHRWLDHFLSIGRGKYKDEAKPRRLV
jgi:hypothetical protein